LKDQSNTPNAGLSSSDKGWYITLDPASGANGAERMTGGVSANPNGVVFYTTFIPSTDLCEAGGVPSQWAVNYSTGGVPPARAMQGKVIMTTSDQPIAKPVNIGGAYTQRGGRKLDASISNNLRGVPPPQPPPTVTLPPPVKRIMNIMER
jgi:type IV pilus assembly protein PilY1